MNVIEYLSIPVVNFGRTRDGSDCWGLVCIIYREQLGIHLPLYEFVDPTKDREVWFAIAEETSKKDWIEVPASERREFDVVVLRIKGTPWHVGVLLDGRSFIHADPTRGVCIEKLDSLHWKNRVVGYFRLPEQQ